MSIESILNNAIKLIEKDLKTIEAQVESGEPLDRMEAQKLSDYTKTLITASKNERDITKLESLNNISDEELEQLAAEAIKELEGEK
jgi:hypothetical protein